MELRVNHRVRNSVKVVHRHDLVNIIKYSLKIQNRGVDSKWQLKALK